MYYFRHVTRIQEGASYEDIEDGDCFEEGWEITDEDGEIIYDFADDETKEEHERFNYESVYD